jgi:hypothetical protein
MYQREINKEVNVEDALIFKILKNDLVTVLHRSVVRSTAVAIHRNKRVSCYIQ